MLLNTFERSKISGGQVTGYRWVVLAAFGLVLFSQALLWLTFAPIETEVQTALGVGHFAVRLLALVDPLIFIALAAFVGILADRRGFRFTVSLGLGLMVPAAVARAVAANLGLPGHTLYWILLAMQLVISAGACCCVVCIFQMPVKWFPENQRGTATGLTTMSLLLGNAAVFPMAALIGQVPTSPSPPQAMEAVSRVLDVFAVVALVAALLFYALVRREPEAPPVEGRMAPDPAAARRLLALPDFRALSLIFFYGMGLYIALLLTMEKLMGFHGFSTEFAALVAGAVTVGGIAGSAILPAVSDRIGRRRPFILLPAVVAMPMSICIAFLPVRSLVIACAAVLGFIMLAAQPVLFTMLGEMDDVGPQLAGTAVGVLYALGSIGQIVVPLLAELFHRTSPTGALDYRWSILVLAALGLAGFLLVVRNIPETKPGD